MVIFQDPTELTDFVGFLAGGAMNSLTDEERQATDKRKGDSGAPDNLEEIDNETLNAVFQKQILGRNAHEPKGYTEQSKVEIKLIKKGSQSKLPPPLARRHSVTGTVGIHKMDSQKLLLADTGSKAKGIPQFNLTRGAGRKSSIARGVRSRKSSIAMIRETRAAERYSKKQDSHLNAVQKRRVSVKKLEPIRKTSIAAE